MADVAMVPVRHQTTGLLAAVPADAVTLWQSYGWQPIGPYVPPVIFDPNIDAIGDGQVPIWNEQLSRFQAGTALTSEVAAASFATKPALVGETTQRLQQFADFLAAADPRNDRAVLTALINSRTEALRRFAREPGVVGGWSACPLISVIGNNVLDQNAVYLEPMWSGDGLTIDQLDLAVSTAAAGATIRTGIYVSAATPGTSFSLGSVFNLLAESDVKFDASSTGRKPITPTASTQSAPTPWPLVIPADTIYWTATSAEGAGTVQVRSASAAVGGGGNRGTWAPLGSKVDSSTSALVAPSFTALKFTRSSAGALPATLTFSNLGTQRSVWGGGVGVSRAA